MSSSQQAGVAVASDWVSGNWSVTDGNEAVFLARWEQFLRWTRAEAAGFRVAYLIRDRVDPGHFISLAQCDSIEAARAWRRLPGFVSHFMACRGLCQDFYAADYLLEVQV